VKRIYVAAIVAASLSLPLLSHAQSTGTHITRAQVRAELIAAEKAGQYPQSYSHYPDASPDAALEYVANRAEARTDAAEPYGSSGAGQSESGFRHFRENSVAHEQPDNFDIYRGH
jgi:hypothetical protein